MNLMTRLRAAGELFKALGNEKALGSPTESKSVYDKLPVGVQGRPQRPATNINALYRYHRSNELVFACIRAIADAASDPEPVVERRGKDNKWEPDEAHPMRRLLLWPNPVMDGATFTQHLVVSAQISGYFYAEIVRDGLDLPDQLWPLDPTKISPIPGPGSDGGFIKGYEFREGSQREFIDAKNMLAMRLPNPASRFQALSPLEVCAGSVDAESAQTDYIRAFFNSAGVPSGLLKIKKTMSDEQVRALQLKWLAKYGRRGTMQGAPAVLDENAEYQRTGANLNELEADALRGQSQAAICSAFGVPPILVGAYVALMYVNQRASVREAQRDFWQNTMSPMFRKLRLFLTTRLLSEFEGMVLIKGDRVRMNWSMEHVAGMQEDKDAVHKRAREDFNGGGLSFNEFRAKIGEAPAPDGDYFILPRGYKPITPKTARAQATTSAIVADSSVSDPEGGDPVPGDGGDGNDQTRTKAVPGGALVNPPHAPGGPTESKAFQYEGLDLRREPTELEKKADLRQVAKTMDTGAAKLEKVLLRFRDQMIEAAVADLIELEPGEYHTLAITVTAAQTKQVRQLLGDIFERGRETVARELANQAEEKKRFSTADRKGAVEAFDRLDTLAAATLAKLANDVQARAIGRASELVLLGFSEERDAAESKAKKKTLKEKLLEDLEEGSTQYASRAASGATNVALNLGRNAEAEDRAEEIKEVVYSAVLDQNTCGPCEDADGETGPTDADVPTAPNPACEGGSQCRCIHIHVLA